MPREITSHRVNGLNESLKIEVRDDPGAGGACHRYDITGFDTETNPSATPPDGFKASFIRLVILFQNGPVKEAGVNGISQEALLAIVKDRLECFQHGPYACEDNADALFHVAEAMHWLQKRTRDRMARNVEGTNAK